MSQEYFSWNPVNHYQIYLPQKNHDLLYIQFVYSCGKYFIGYQSIFNSIFDAKEVQILKVLLILTATINPSDMTYLKRSDLNVCLRDYLQALKSWIEREDAFEIVFCENSMHRLDELYELVRRYHPKSTVHFLQFDGNSYPRDLGKGYGEAKIINHVLDSFEQLNSYTYLIKCTGRIYVPNLHKILGRSIMYADFISMPPKPLASGARYIDSRIFAGDPQAFRKIFNGFAKEVNDSKSIFFEQVLAHRLQIEIKNGLNWLPFEDLPRYIGISGTSGHSLNKPIEYYLRSIKYQLMRSNYKKLMANHR